MTTPINNFQDILDAMERDPALRDTLRRHILTEELLQVPVRLERVEADVKTLKEDVKVLKEDVAVLKEDVAELKEGQARLTVDVSVLTADVSVLREDVNRMGGELSKMGGNVSRLLGADYESHVATYAHRFLRRSLGITASVFSCQRNKAPLTRLLDEAEAQGLIDSRETDDLDKADLVLIADGPTDYLLAEVSLTVQQDDIDRAVERAGLLAKATTQGVTPFAIGAREQPGIRRGDVRVILIPESQVP